MNNKVISIPSSAILTESIITYFKELFVSENFFFNMFFSTVLGVLIAVVYDMDLPEYLNLKSSIPYIGNILTGVLI